MKIEKENLKDVCQLIETIRLHQHFLNLQAELENYIIGKNYMSPDLKEALMKCTQIMNNIISELKYEVLKNEDWNKIKGWENP